MSRKPERVVLPPTTIPSVPELDRTGEILTKALERLDGGRHWTQGQLRRHFDQGTSYCAIGAIYATTPNFRERHRAVVRLAEEVPSFPFLPPRRRVWVYNDERSGGFRGIQDVFERAIKASYRHD